jgi:hypothetical protein
VDVPANRNTIFTLVKREGNDLIDLQKKELEAKQRNKLPRSSFAWVDSEGKGHLPINDEAHVRNAMARFNQTNFDSPEAKRRAYHRIMRAAGRFGIKVDNFKEKYGKDVIPEWVEQQHDQFAKYMYDSLGKEVEGMNEIEKKKAPVFEEDVVEEAEETAPKTEEAPQAPKETPEAPKPETEETKPTETPVETKVSEEPPQTVVDETKQTADTTEDITKRLEKLEQTVKESPKPTKEDGLAKLEKRYDYQLAKVVSVIERLAERLEQVEKMAAPVKAKPSFLVEKVDKPETEEKAKLESRLEELTKIRDSDLARYQREDLGKEALSIFDKLAKMR